MLKLKRKAKIANAVFKIAFFSAIVFLSWLQLLNIGGTSAFYIDSIGTMSGHYWASDLDLSLGASDDVSPLVTPEQPASRDIKVFNSGKVMFEFKIRADNFSGPLCGQLNLDASLNGTSEYSGTLDNFSFSGPGFFSYEDWDFTFTLQNDDPVLENLFCHFDFVFNGDQFDDGGFNDQETISNTVRSGQWYVPPSPSCKLAINEVYYYPDEAHQGQPNEEMFEWIELHNDCDEIINLKDWRIADNAGEEIIHQNYPVEPGQYVLIAANAAVWNTYWSIIPENAVKIALGGQMMSDGLDNAGDRVNLYDDKDNKIDSVEWGSDGQDGQSYIRDVDGNWIYSDNPTPGDENKQ
jgi:hypothetical protein